MAVDYYLEIVATLEIALTPHIHRPGKKRHLISRHDFHIISHLRGAQTQCFCKELILKNPSHHQNLRMLPSPNATGMSGGKKTKKTTMEPFKKGSCKRRFHQWKPSFSGSMSDLGGFHNPMIPIPNLLFLFFLSISFQCRQGSLERLKHP